ncbi:uncharacterized protein METZ01_LOCUS473126, partial [marine metagenome]
MTKLWDLSGPHSGPPTRQQVRRCFQESPPDLAVLIVGLP